MPDSTYQPALFGDAEPDAPRTWADVRVGERVAYDVPGSPWRGTWTVRRIEDHPRAPYALIVHMVDNAGRTWVSVPHRKALADA